MSQSSGASAILRLGTRGSPLALAQARMVRDAIAGAHRIAPERIEIHPIRTTGDRVQDRPLADAGGKGLFAKEIEEALVAGAIDLAVHSAKDMPSFLPDGLLLAAYLKREDPRDVFISRKATSFAGLPSGATVGTSSPRRQALTRRLRPDLRIVDLRGNIETRLRKLDEGAADATLLALAGLKRLGLEEKATRVLDTGEFLPAVAQGAICIETRAADERTRAMLVPVNDEETAITVTAERAFLAALDGSCRTPIAGHATLRGGQVRFRGMVIKPDGSEAFEAERMGAIVDAAHLGDDAGRELRQRAGADFFLP